MRNKPETTSLATSDSLKFDPYKKGTSRELVKNYFEKAGFTVEDLVVENSLAVYEAEGLLYWINFFEENDYFYISYNGKIPAGIPSKNRTQVYALLNEINSKQSMLSLSIQDDFIRYSSVFFCPFDNARFHNFRAAFAAVYEEIDHEYGAKMASLFGLD